ncbi:MAG TPA: HXXEE domain-containing protein [Terracidiphilus sp.]|nr:HXXEE domain-containing protein [Terracidiphilus sp.]
MSYRNLMWLFPIVVTLHNAEEAIWLPGWSKRAVIWHSPVTPGVFRFAVVVLTVLAFAVTWLSAVSGKQTVWTYLAFGCMAVTLANVLIPHLALTVALRSYMPGVATAVALNLPVLSLLVVLALREEYVSGWKAAAYSVGVAGLLIATIPALFKIGRALNL